MGKNTFGILGKKSVLWSIYKEIVSDNGDAGDSFFHVALGILGTKSAEYGDGVKKYVGFRSLHV